MPRGDKSKYTDQQERKADHIAESYESRGVSEPEAERRAWATVNKQDGGGKKGRSGRKTEAKATRGSSGRSRSASTTRSRAGGPGRAKETERK